MRIFFLGKLYVYPEKGNREPYNFVFIALGNSLFLSLKKKILLIYMKEKKGKFLSVYFNFL